jgi:protein-S-isoprenylcysteine O-methyltransferase Ste14
MSYLSAWNIAVGQWFFRYRNAAFPIIFTVAPVLFLRPRVMFGHPGLDRLLVACGVLVTVAGEVVRLLTIGFEYIERGGKNKQVWASRLVQGGVYAHTRNPMYLGNLLIAVGMCMVSGSPAAYLVVIPLFVFIYQAIMAAEEAFLHQKFGADYVAYCSGVPRMFPALKGIRRTFADSAYDWRRAVRKDLGTMTGLCVGMICWFVWRTYFLEGFAAAKAMAPAAFGLIAAVLVLYGLLHHLKKRRLLFYLPGHFPPDAPGSPR